jgi:hypothetical protein
MNTGILKVVGQVAGIGGVALGVFLLLFRDVIRKNVFPKLGRDQAYRLLTLIVVLVWSVALAGIAAWVWVTVSNGRRPPNATVTESKNHTLALHQELAEFRDQLWQPAQPSEPNTEGYPDFYESCKQAKWPEPRRSSVEQIVTLAGSEPVAVVRSLTSFLYDSDGVVVVGTLLALSEILGRQTDKRDELRALLPNGGEQPLNLRGTYIPKADFSVFAGTELFRNAQFQASVLEGVSFDGLQMSHAQFGNATVIDCSFKSTALVMSTWNDAKVRETDFGKADLRRVFATGGDFGDASSGPTGFFGPNTFYETTMNDAVFNDSKMIAARLHKAKLDGAEFADADFTDAYLTRDELASEEGLRKEHVLFFQGVKYGRRLGSESLTSPNKTLSPTGNKPAN